MRRYIFLIILILLLGATFIVTPLLFEDTSFFSSHGTKVSGKFSASNKDTITKPELSFDEMETGIYDKNQMYFKNVEALYNKLKYSQVEQLKQNIQYFIHQYVNKDTKECIINTDSIISEGKTISFSVSVNNSVMKVSYLNGKAQIELSIKN